MSGEKSLDEIKNQLIQNLRQKKINDYLAAISKNAKIEFLGQDISPNEIANTSLLEKLDN